jgi:hypothetical protein
MAALEGTARNITQEQMATVRPTMTRLLVVATTDQSLKDMVMRNAATMGAL